MLALADANIRKQDIYLSPVCINLFKVCHGTLVEEFYTTEFQRLQPLQQKAPWNRRLAILVRNLEGLDTKHVARSM
jgi:hypothetical protein